MANPNHSYFVPIRFRGAEKSYYFSTEYSDLKLGDLVVVDSVSGYTMGAVAGTPKPLTEYHSQLELKPVLRKPTKSDMLNHNFNLKEEKRALAIVAEEIAKLNLPMDLLDAVFTLDGTYITITYTSTEKRVDFRELLHQIIPLLNCRVELRQVAPRDRAKLTGGLGICGLPLCCSTFLTSFESISIGKAKNQMLTLNIPKLSGHCGKLICCLDFEDEAYTEAKKEFPKFGTKINTPDGEYAVDSFNIISKTVRLANETRDDFKTYPLEDIIAMQNGTYKEKVRVLKKEEELPSFNISPRDNENDSRSEQRRGNNERREEGGRNQRHHHHHNNQRPNSGGNNQKPNTNGNNERPNNNGQKGQNPQQNQPNSNQHRNNHHRHHHGGRNRNKGNNGGKAE